MLDLDLLLQKSKLIPVIIQDAGDGAVLMLGFTNREAVERTLQTKTGNISFRRNSAFRQSARRRTARRSPPSF